MGFKMKSANPQSEFMDHHRFPIGLVLADLPSKKDTSVYAIQSSVSNCIVTHVVILKEDCEEASVYQWLELHHINGSSVRISFGQNGFEDLLRSTTEDTDGTQPSIQAVYLVVPTQQQSQYVLTSLEAGKHVLLNDPQSTSLEDFTSQMKLARRHQKVVQFSTMFVHHHRVEEFLDCVDSKFGSVEEIQAILTLNHRDLNLVDVDLPLTAGNGCIRRLGRYCVLISTLLLTRMGSQPEKVQVTCCEYDPDSGVPISADCVVEWTMGRKLQLHVSYEEYAPSRQVLTVRSKDRYATMTDFCLPHPDGLATYRVYDREPNPLNHGQLEVVRGEALDVRSGPPQAIMMWRRFEQLCRMVDEQGWDRRSDDTTTYSFENSNSAARELASVAMQTKRILMAIDDQTISSRGSPIHNKPNNQERKLEKLASFS